MKITKAKISDRLHFTGGLYGYRNHDGWMIGPLLVRGQIVDMGPIPECEVDAVAAAMGIRVFGNVETHYSDEYLNAKIWHPFVLLEGTQDMPTELWSNISLNTSKNEFDNDSALARKISTCLLYSNIRLRNLSECYQNQLKSAIINRANDGVYINNFELMDLYLAAHSFLTEMSSARYYLASWVARHVGAPSKIDSLARLFKWLEDKKNREFLTDQKVILLLKSYHEDGGGWLKSLTEYRNFFLHREPLGSSDYSSDFRLISNETKYGLVRTGVVAIPKNIDGAELIDALSEFVRIHWFMFRMAASMALLSPYPRSRIVVGSKDMRS